MTYETTPPPRPETTRSRCCFTYLPSASTARSTPCSLADETLLDLSQHFVADRLVVRREIDRGVREL